MCGPRQEEKLLAIACLLEKTLGKPRDILGSAPLFS